MKNIRLLPDGISIRTIRKEDDPSIGSIIRGCFKDYGASECGTVCADPVIDHLSDVYGSKRSRYFVLETKGQVVGGAGIHSLKEAEATICELQKMYIRKDFRGKGLGRALLDTCLEFARSSGYETCYLESLPELKDALRLYERSGFSYIDSRMGNTGYFGCSLYMIKNLG